MTDSGVTSRFLLMIREGSGRRGVWRMPDWPEIVWAMAERWPEYPRPRLHQITTAIDELRGAGRITTGLDHLGRRSITLRDEQQPPQVCSIDPFGGDQDLDQGEDDEPDTETAGTRERADERTA